MIDAEKNVRRSIKITGPEGRQSNRRVQLEIRPNEKLKARQG
ncbi:hypothetical protein [Candidatus Deferrimicrobium sp.]